MSCETANCVTTTNQQHSTRLYLSRIIDKCMCIYIYIFINLCKDCLRIIPLNTIEFPKFINLKVFAPTPMFQRARRLPPFCFCGQFVLRPIDGATVIGLDARIQKLIISVLFELMNEAFRPSVALGRDHRMIQQTMVQRRGPSRGSGVDNYIKFNQLSYERKY